MADNLQSSSELADYHAVNDQVMQDPRYLAARADMAARIRAYERSIINDANLSDDEYHRLSTHFGYELTKQLYRNTSHLFEEARAARSRHLAEGA
jgi:hypothetical protein